VHVRTDEVLIRQVKAGSGHRAGDHFPGVPEVVRVVSVSGGAVGDHQSGLTGTSRPTGPLRVVRRGGWNVPQAHCIETGDVDTEFHGRGTEQQWQCAGAELLFAFLAFFRRHLRGVLLGL